jgi:hypothetical protein
MKLTLQEMLGLGPLALALILLRSRFASNRILVRMVLHGLHIASTARLSLAMSQPHSLH